MLQLFQYPNQNKVAPWRHWSSSIIICSIKLFFIRSIMRFFGIINVIVPPNFFHGHLIKHWCCKYGTWYIKPKHHWLFIASQHLTICLLDVLKRQMCLRPWKCDWLRRWILEKNWKCGGWNICQEEWLSRHVK